jgi:hypothetical protein
MTKFSDEFINDVKSYWEDNKGKFKHTEKSGIHREVLRDKKFGMQDLADHFNITFSQAKRIVYVVGK